MGGAATGDFSRSPETFAAPEQAIGRDDAPAHRCSDDPERRGAACAAGG